MSFITVSTPAAPEPVGAYSQGRRIGPFLQVCGQIATDAATGAVLRAGIAEQTRRALKQVEAVLAADGADWQERPDGPCPSHPRRRLRSHGRRLP